MTPPTDNSSEEEEVSSVAGAFLGVIKPLAAAYASYAGAYEEASQVRSKGEKKAPALTCMRITGAIDFMASIYIAYISKIHGPNARRFTHSFHPSPPPK
jgi:hypothetical protein